MMRDFRLFTLALAVLLLAALAPAAHAGDHYPSCVSDCDCPKWELCGKDGQCFPVLCPEIYDPVCGVDGKTYGNACEAKAAHVVVAHDGPCEEFCGGIAGIPCPDGKVCDLRPGLCGVADLDGVCKPRPEACPEIYKPVCSCDGKTYGNDCERLRAGAQKAHDGECKPKTALAEPMMAVTSCKQSSDCGSGEYCQFPWGECGGTGTCQVRPRICNRVWNPVCGCDGRSYSNACNAAGAGESVKYGGECK